MFYKFKVNAIIESMHVNLPPLVRGSTFNLPFLVLKARHLGMLGLGLPEQAIGRLSLECRFGIGSNTTCR